MEKLVNMMEESVVEQPLDADQRLRWKNRIAAHREFIRAHQDAVGKAISAETSKLKKHKKD